MKIVVYQSFKRAFKRLIKKNHQLQDRILRVIALLENDPFTPSLKTHKLTGNLQDYWSCSVTYDCRIIFLFKEDEEAEETLIILVDIGFHDDVY
jgi:addiction module RelE/StbE family toxin